MMILGFFGQVTQPAALAAYGSSDGTLIKFMNNILTLIVVAGGLWTVFNVVVAGFTYITAQGDPKAMSKVVSTLTQSLLGLILMITAPVVAAIIGFVFFKDASFIISPKL